MIIVIFMYSFDTFKYTLKYIQKYGIDNVRGSLFTNPFGLSKYEKVMAAQLYCDLHNLCRKCGGKGHFITQCKNDSVEDWVHNFGGMLEFSEDRKCLTCSKSINCIPRNFKRGIGRAYGSLWCLRCCTRC